MYVTASSLVNLRYAFGSLQPWLSLRASAATELGTETNCVEFARPRSVCYRDHASVKEPRPITATVGITEPGRDAAFCGYRQRVHQGLRL